MAYSRRADDDLIGASCPGPPWGAGEGFIASNLNFPALFVLQTTNNKFEFAELPRPDSRNLFLSTLYKISLREVGSRKTNTGTYMDISYIKMILRPSPT